MSHRLCHIVSILSERRQGRVSMKVLARLLSLCCIDYGL